MAGETLTSKLRNNIFPAHVSPYLLAASAASLAFPRGGLCYCVPSLAYRLLARVHWPVKKVLSLWLRSPAPPGSATPAGTRLPSASAGLPSIISVHQRFPSKDFTTVPACWPFFFLCYFAFCFLSVCRYVQYMPIWTMSEWREWDGVTLTLWFVFIKWLIYLSFLFLWSFRRDFCSSD